MTDDVFVLPMSPAQQRLWFLDQLDPGTTMFNIPAAFRLYGPLDVTRLERALSAIVDRHEVLRTTLTSLDGDAVQIVHPSRPVHVPVHDLSALRPEQADAALRRELRAAAARPFDLAAGPLFRPEVWRLADDDHVVMLCLHHAIADGWSLGVLYAEFAALWNAEAAGLPAPLAPLEIQYGDYAHWHREQMASGALAPQQQYWHRQLAGHRGILRLPTDRPRPPRQTFNAGAYEFRVDPRTVDAVRAFGKETGVTLFMSCITAYACLLWRYSGQRDVLVGIPAAGRTESALEPLIGFFVNALAIRFRIDPSAPVRALSLEARQTVLDAFTHQSFSIDALMEALSFERHPAYEPLVQTAFALQNMTMDAGALTGVDVEPVYAECMHTRYDLMLLMSETPEGLVGNMVYNSDLFDRTTIAAMMAHYERLLAGMAAAPDAMVATIAPALPSEAAVAVGATPREIERIVPLAPMQRDIYLDALANPASLQNNVGCWFEIAAPVRSDVWASVVQAVTDAQPMLRTRMRAAAAPFAESVYQCVWRQAEANVEIVDLSSAADVDAACASLLEAFVQRPYDPHGPLVRHALVKLTERRWIAAFANHHMLLDGIASVQVVTTIAAEYTRRTAADADATIPAFTDPSAFLFVEHVDEMRRATDTRAALDEWQRRLSKTTPLTAPTVDRDASGVVSQDAVLDAALWKRVKSFTRKRRVTPQVLMKCAFAILADAYCGGDGDVLIQEFVAGRPKGHATALGCYYRAAPFVVPRAQLDGSGPAGGLDLRADDGIDGLLAYARDWQRESADLPVISLLELRQLAPPGRVSLLFNYITAKLTVPVARGDATLVRRTPYADGSLQCEVSVVGDEVHVSLVYDRRVFTETRWLERFVSVLEQIVDGATSSAALSFELPHEAAASAATPARDAGSIPERIAAQARRTPDAPAIVQAAHGGAQGATLTYRELATRVDHLAARLMAIGVQPGDLVGVCFERSPAMVVALLAALRAGAAYVPMDAAYPADRLRHMTDDARCRVVITSPALASIFDTQACDVVTCASNASDVPVTPAPRAWPARTPESMFYVLYTSGSTGTPKGAVVLDRGEHNLIDWYIGALAIAPADRVLVISAFGFDLTQKNFFAALIAGAAIVLPALAPFDPDDVRRAASDGRATIVNCAPSAFYALIEDPSGWPALASLTHIVLGGEPIRMDRLAGFLAHPSIDAEVINSYGPTECTDVVAAYRVHDPQAFLARDVPLGPPLPGVSLHVVDRLHRALPPYAVGELCIAGVSVGAGYWHQDALTRAAFVPNPFGEGRLYRTGDLAYVDANGVPVYLGRKDFQVKVRGLRIELGEIEAALAEAFPGSEWVVLADNDTLMAVARAAEGAMAIDDVHARLSARLPAYMLPQAVGAVSEWPLGPNGKIDRAALIGVAGRHARERRVSPPETETERRLAALWSEVLDRSSVGRDESFFAIGGHSLLAARVAGRIRADFGIEFPLRTLFDEPTLASMAAAIDRASDAGDVRPDRTTAPIPRADRRGALPLSFPQRRLWFLERLDGGSAAYNMPAAVRLTGALDVDALARACGALVERHEVLRTRIVDVDGEPSQCIDPPLPNATSVVRRISLVQSPDPDRDLRAEIDREAQHVFDLASEHPFRAAIITLASDDHVLVMTLHHIAADGWSTGIVLAECAAFYNAFARGAAPDLAPLPVQYADVAVWQHTSVPPAQIAADVAYWRDVLTRHRDAADETATAGAITLPGDGRRDAPPMAGGTVPFTLDAHTFASVSALADRTGASVYMVLLAAFYALLARWSGETDLTVGSPIANRPRKEMEGLIGFFVNTLALRVSVDDDPTFERLVERVRAMAVEAYAHAAVPFEQLVEQLNPERRLDRSPFFQVMFAMQSGVVADASLDGVRMQPLPVETGASRLDLTMSLQETPAGVAGVVEYAAAVFSHESAQRFAEHYRTLLASALRAPHTPIAALDMMSRSERHRVLVEWNRTTTDADRSLTIHELFERQAARTPDAPAIRHEHDVWTYRQLLDASTRVACWLHAQGVAGGGPASDGAREDVLVGVSMPRTPELIAALIGVLRAGAAYVALDPAYPAERNEYIRADSRARVVVTLDDVRSAPEPITPLPPSGASPHSLAYVLYTSGSTGRPKGVAIEHRSPVALLQWAQSVWTPQELSGVLAGTSICFDLSVFEIFLPLSVGGAIVLAPNVLELPSVPQRAHVTLINTVPSAIDALLIQRGIPESVRVVNLAGEPLTTELADRVHDVPTIEKVFDLYGPSEDTTYSTCARRRRGDAPTIGRPIANTQLYILDARLQPMPPGLPGEIYLGGEGLARGYLWQPEMTRERFVDNPFAPGTRLYRTGDLAKFRADGCVEFIGRRDHQVKLRGFRIELGEIEAVIREYPGVTHCVVTVQTSSAGVQRLAAHVAHPQGVAIQTELHALLKRRLPDYMVPPVIVILDRLPLTPNGKIDRQALPMPEQTAPTSTRRPLRDTERRLAELWADLLGHRVADEAHDADFFASGGHSLLAVRLTSRIGAAFGVTMPLRVVFEHPRLDRQAAAIERLQAESPPEARDIEPLHDRARLPLSFAQERLWFLDQLEPGNTAYNMVGAVRLRGRVDLAALGRAFARVIAAHEVLRTVYPTIDGRGVGVPLPQSSWPVLHTVDLRSLSSVERAGNADAFVRDAARHPFDLTHGPLVRASALRLADDETMLVVALHHIVSDGWSNTLIVREWCAAYANDVALDAPLLHGERLQYADVAAWQRAEWERGAWTPHLMYWRETLADAPVRIALPTDRPRPPAQSYRGSSVTLAVPRQAAAAVRALAARSGATPFAVWLAGFAAALSQWASIDDVVVGVPVAGRTRPEFEAMAGLFANTLPLRVRAERHLTADAFMAAVKATSIDGLAHQQVPFEKLVDALRVERHLSWSPLFQVMFVMQHAQASASLTSTIALESVPAPESETTKFDLTLAIAENADGFSGVLEYDRALFDASTLVAFGERLTALLVALAADGDMPLARALGPASGAPTSAPAAPQPAPASSDMVHARASDAQRALLDVWRAILRVESLSIDDNFFERGGDSIVSIRVIAAMRERGWKIDARQIFQHQTIRALAPTAVRIGGEAAPAAESRDPLPLTPLQRMFLASQPASPSHFNQAVLFRLDAAADTAALHRALRAVQHAHPALRSRFDADGQRITADADVPLDVYRADGATRDDRARHVTQQCDDVQRRIDIAAGPVFRAARITGVDTDDRLLLVAHHLVVDAVSWHIIASDIESAYAAARRGDVPAVAPELVGPTAFRAAAAIDLVPERLSAESSYGDRVRAVRPSSLPRASRSVSGKHSGAARGIERTLSDASTRVLTSDLHRLQQATVADALLASLSRALTTVGDEGPAVIDIEGHGRDVIAHLDLSRSVGWFTSVCPAVVARPHADADALAWLRAAKAAAAAMPRQGAAFAWVPAAQAAPVAEMSFNYLGQTTSGPDASVARTPTTHTLLRGTAPEATGHSSASDTPRRYRIDCNAALVNGVLVMQFSYDASDVDDAVANSLADRTVEALSGIAHALAGEQADLIAGLDLSDMLGQ